MRKLLLIILLTTTALCHAKETKGTLFFFRLGERIDRFMLQKVDTNYINLPEYSWQLDLSSGLVGVNSAIHSTDDYGFGPDSDITLSLFNRTTPSVDLGFNAGYRGIGFGYSWDLLHAYDRRFNFNIGSKAIGVDFFHQRSSNIHTRMAINNEHISLFDADNVVKVTNTSLGVWYALNSAHYSHHAATKQTYIQRKTAGSLLLHLSYMESNIAFSDTILIEEAKRPTFSALMSDVTAMTTRQVAVGLGYGINYTPNHGKVLLHLSAAAMLVCYSVNHVSYFVPDSLKPKLPGEPMYVLQSAHPVHVTGNVRAAVSWEINRYVHLSAWASGNNIRFYSEKAFNGNELTLSNWNWQVHLNVGVRLGVDSRRVHEALKDDPVPPAQPVRTTKLPRWLTDFFFSPSL